MLSKMERRIDCCLLQWHMILRQLISIHKIMRQYLPFVVNWQQLLAIYLATAQLHKELARVLDTLTPLLSLPLLPHFQSNNTKGEQLKTMAEEQKVIIPRVKLGNQGLEVKPLFTFQSFSLWISVSLLDRCLVKVQFLRLTWPCMKYDIPLLCD
jgi:hypothetical protein